MKLGIISALALTTALVGVPSASAEDLKEALAAAYSSNPELAAQRASLDATRQGVSRARSGMLPQVSGSYNESKSASKTDGSAGFSPYIDSKSASISATQTLFSGFQNRNAVKAAKQISSAAEAQFLSLAQRIYLDTVTAYMNVLRDEAVYNLNQNLVTVLKRELTASKDRFQVGDNTRTDVAQSEARLAGAEAQTINARATLAASRAVYEQIVGMAPGTLVQPKALPVLPGTLDDALNTGLNLSPIIAAASHNEKAAGYSLKQAKGGLSPSVRLDASWSKRQNDGQFFAGQQFPSSTTTSKSAGVTLSVPIFAGGSRYSDIRRAKSVKSQRMHEITVAERQVRTQVRQAWDQFLAAKSSIQSTEAQVRANTIALDGVTQEAAVGSRTTLDVLNAKQELLDSEVNLVSAQRNKFVAAYNLKAAIGDLTFDGMQ